MQSRSAGPVSTKTKDAWVLALAVILPLLTFGNCVTRGTDFGPWHADYLIQIGILLGCVGLCVRLVRHSRIGVMLFLIYGGLLSLAPELYWGPQDLAFYREVQAIDPYLLEEDLVRPVIHRRWPCSDYSIHYSGGEFWSVD